jgi:AmmeMemoRadiSam system protein A
MSRLSNDDCRVLLDLARRAICVAVSTKQILDIPPYPAALANPAGAFVTLHRDGRLRGCVGQVESSDPLADTVVRAAINAAVHDSRFPEVEVSELERLDIEISVLSIPEPILPEAIVTGLHGLLVVKGEKRGLLLPQVAVERQWSSQRFLEETCAKAGLRSDAWREPSTRVLAFTAEVFSDESVRVGDSGRMETEDEIKPRPSHRRGWDGQ